MAKRKPKQILVLDNGVEVKTTSDGWSKEYIDSLHILVEGWGSNPHFGISQGFLIAVGKKLPELVKGETSGKKVIDAIGLCEDILNTYIDVKDLDVQKIRIAGSKAPKLTPDMIAMKQAMDASPEMQAIFKEQNPEMYAKMYPDSVEEEEDDSEDEESEEDDEEEIKD